MRKQLVKTVEDTLKNDSSLVLLLGDIGVYGFKDSFSSFPDRVYNIGILEDATVSLAAGLAKTGPDVTLISTSNSFAKIFASVVFPNPGGPWNNVWSKASFLWFAASTKIFKLLMTWSWPEKSSKETGLKLCSLLFSDEFTVSFTL